MKIFVDKPGEKSIDISYAYQGKNAGGNIFVLEAGEELAGKIEPTGLTVGEPNQDWHIDNFTSHNLGKVEFERS